MKIVSKKKPEKSLLTRLKTRAGRSNTGRITIRHRGGGARRLYRQIDFAQGHIDMPGKVLAIEHDPNRTALLALVQYENNEKAYLLAPYDLKVGEEVVTTEKGEVKTGNRMRLLNIPVGTVVYNIEVAPEQGGKLVRGAGASAQVLAHDAGYTHLRMPSGEARKISSKSFASVGSLSNPEHRYKVLRKAGTRRKMGWRPTVRGTVMNPVDHPHGGGEGRTGRGMKYPKTPWGKHALGVKTRKKKWSDKLIVQRRKKKKKK